MQVAERYRTLLAHALPPAAVFLAAALLFARSVENEFLPFDDALYVTGNAQVQQGLSAASIAWAFTTGHAANWHPITWLSHMLDAELFGLDAQGHHATSVLLHAINSTLVYFFTLRITQRRMASAAVALLFAVHPLHVESVAWVSSRKDLLCALFWFLGLFAYLRYAAAPSRRGYALVTAAFVLAFLAKPVAVTFPLVLLVLDFWPLARFSGVAGAIAHRQLLLRVAEKIPLLLLAAVFSAITVGVQRAGGAMDEIGGVSLGARINNALSSVPGYLAHALWPLRLYIPYPHPGETRPAWQGITAGLLILAFSAGLYLLRRRRPALLAAWLWFLIISLPTLGFIQVGFQSMADRYMYLPLLGPIAIAVALAVDSTGSLKHSARIRVGVAAATIILLGVLSWRQQAHWRDGVALFSHAVAMRPSNVPARVQLAVIHLMAERPELAEEQLLAALKTDPSSAQVWSNLGSAQRMLGRKKEAEASFRRAIELEPGAYAPALNLAALLGGARRVDEAVALLERAVKSPEETGEGYSLLADFYVMRGDTEKAGRARAEAARLAGAVP